MAKFKFKVGTGTFLSVHEQVVEIPDELLTDSVLGDHRTDVVECYFREWVENTVESEWVEIKEEETS